MVSSSGASDPIWHLLEWIVEDALPTRPSHVRIRIAPDSVMAEHNGFLFPRTAAALALVVARRKAKLTRVLHGITTLEVYADGSSREIALPVGVRVDGRRTFIEWEPSATPSADRSRLYTGEVVAQPLRLCDVKAFLQFLPAGGTHPVTFRLEVLIGRVDSVQQQLAVERIEYDPPLCDLRAATAQWLGRSSAAEIGAGCCARAGVSVTATAALEAAADGASCVRALHLLPFVDWLPLPRDKQAECAQCLLSGVNWARFGLAVGAPAEMASMAATSGTATVGRGARNGQPIGSAAAALAAAAEQPHAQGARRLAALRLPITAQAREGRARGRSTDVGMNGSPSARDSLSASPAAPRAPQSPAAQPQAGGSSADRGGGGGDAAEPQLELFVSLHVHTLDVAQRGTSTVARWDELTAEQRSALAPTVAAALDDLCALSPAAKRALLSAAERSLALVRDVFIPQMAASIVALAAGCADGGHAQLLRMLAPASGGADEARGAVSARLGALLDSQLVLRKKPKPAARNGGSRRRRRAEAEVDDDEGVDEEEEEYGACLEGGEDDE